MYVQYLRIDLQTGLHRLDICNSVNLSLSPGLSQYLTAEAGRHQWRDGERMEAERRRRRGDVCADDEVQPLWQLLRQQDQVHVLQRLRWSARHATCQRHRFPRQFHLVNYLRNMHVGHVPLAKCRRGRGQPVTRKKVLFTPTKSNELRSYRITTRSSATVKRARI